MAKLEKNIVVSINMLALSVIICSCNDVNWRVHKQAWLDKEKEKIAAFARHHPNVPENTFNTNL